MLNIKIKKKYLKKTKRLNHPPIFENTNAKKIKHPLEQKVKKKI